MFTKIEDFESQWNNEAAATQKIMNSLTDKSLDQQVAPGYRSLGELAWHLVTSMHEMLSRTGLDFDAPHHDAPMPASSSAIADTYRKASNEMLQAVRKNWTDESLQKTTDMYGQQWPNGLTLHILMLHQIHHRGQMTVLMRQAGLRVPGVYGPSLEEWQEMTGQSADA